VEEIMFRRKHASHFDSNDADHRKAKVILKVVISLQNKKNTVSNRSISLSISDTTIPERADC